jgi:hypothetical protein
MSEEQLIEEDFDGIDYFEEDQLTNLIANLDVGEEESNIPIDGIHGEVIRDNSESASYPSRPPLGWKYESNHIKNVVFDGADSLFLESGKVVFTDLANRWLKLIKGGSYRPSMSPNNITLAQLVKMWFSGNFLMTVRDQINHCLDHSDAVVGDELWKFIKVEIALMYYGISPTEYFKGISIDPRKSMYYNVEMEQVS